MWYTKLRTIVRSWRILSPLHGDPLTLHTRTVFWNVYYFPFSLFLSLSFQFLILIFRIVVARFHNYRAISRKWYILFDRKKNKTNKRPSCSTTSCISLSLSLSISFSPISRVFFSFRFPIFVSFSVFLLEHFEHKEYIFSFSHSLSEAKKTIKTLFLLLSPAASERDSPLFSRQFFSSSRLLSFLLSLFLFLSLSRFLPISSSIFRR